jgi:hypothetical protein
VKIKNFLGQMPLFEVLRKCHLVTLSKICLWLRPCAYLCGQKWINRIFSKLARAISKIVFILGSYDFLASLECVRSYAWSKGHSDPDLSSVLIKDCNFLDLCHFLFEAIKKIFMY